jgi:5-methyltetrahydrofolate--homocysteine methyltransferase
MTSLEALLALGTPVLMDGGMGTWLQHQGLPVGMPPERWLLDRADTVTAGHRAFVQAGAQLVLTCTLNTHPDSLRPLGLQSWCGELRRLAVAAARASGARVVGGVVGPVRPGLPGPLVHAWAESAGADLMAAGADLLVAETITQTDEGEARVRGMASLGVPVVACVVPGTPAAEALADTAGRLRAAGAAVLGAQCGFPADCGAALNGMGGGWLKPHAGLPGQRMAAEPWADAVVAAMGPHVRWVGGCCEATPEHLQALQRRLSDGRRG